MLLNYQHGIRVQAIPGRLLLRVTASALLNKDVNISCDFLFFSFYTFLNVVFSRSEICQPRKYNIKMRSKMSISYRAIDVDDFQPHEKYQVHSQSNFNRASAVHGATVPFCGLVNWLSSFLSRTWVLEIVLWLVSATLTIGLIGILWIYQDQSVPQWPYRITLNAVISLLSTLARASLLIPVVQALSQLKWLWFNKQRPLSDFDAFDDASRGAWGSLKLLRLSAKG